MDTARPENRSGMRVICRSVEPKDNMTDKTKMILWYFGLAALLAVLSYLAYMRGHSTIAILVIVIPVALIANGFLAEFEDKAPGGLLSGIRPVRKAKEDEK